MDLQDFQFARLIQYAYAQGFTATPQGIDPTPIGFTKVATLLGHGNLEEPCCYGFVAERISDKYRVAVIRGTANPAEWLEDGEFWPERSLWGPGKTEGGFTDVIESIAVRSPDTSRLDEPLDQWGVKAVVGHSLGAAVAEGLAAKYALEYAGLWAAPRLGDGAFVSWLLSRVKKVARFSIEGDPVPDVPFDLPPVFAYQHPPGELLQSPEGVPAGFARHALACYLTVASMSVPLYSHEGAPLA